jgi:hypothetical protein
MTTSYVTYAYYTTTFLGVAIASGDFARLALRASTVIDQVTFNRAAAIVLATTDTDTIDLIKQATCAIAEEILSIEASGNVDGIQSESIGSNSVTYTKGASAQLTSQAKLVKAAKLYLASTGLMFPGFAEGEYSKQADDDAY